MTDADSGIVRYEHALLATPVEMDDGPDLAPVLIHVGGLAWVGQRLFVADTANGLRAFDTSRVFRVDPELSGIGRNGQTGTFAAHGYALALPKIGIYQIAKEGCWHRFSFVSADVTSEPPVLITGEYHGGDVAGKLLTWPLHGERLGVDEFSTFVFPREAFYAQDQSVQGALRANGSWYLSCSVSDGRLFRTAEDEAHETHGWVIGAEDIMYQAEGDLLWSLSEFTGRRFVFSSKRPLPAP